MPPRKEVRRRKVGMDYDPMRLTDIEVWEIQYDNGQRETIRKPVRDYDFRRSYDRDRYYSAPRSFVAGFDPSPSTPKVECVNGDCAKQTKTIADLKAEVKRLAGNVAERDEKIADLEKEANGLAEEFGTAYALVETFRYQMEWYGDEIVRAWEMAEEAKNGTGLVQV